MFHNIYQKGFLSIFYSCGPSPLQIWDMKVKNGCIRRITDKDIKSLVMEIMGTNVSTTYIICPKESKACLGIRMSYMTLILKNVSKYLTFEITIRDNANMCRRFRFSTFQKINIKPFFTICPVRLKSGWNTLNLDLADLTFSTYHTRYVETVRVQINANCLLRRIYFSDKPYCEENTPDELKVQKLSKPRRKTYEISLKTKKGAGKKIETTNSPIGEKVPWIYEKTYLETEITYPMTSPASVGHSETSLLNETEDFEKEKTANDEEVLKHFRNLNEKSKLEDEDEDKDEENEDDDNEIENEDDDNEIENEDDDNKIKNEHDDSEIENEEEGEENNTQEL